MYNIVILLYDDVNREIEKKSEPQKTKLRLHTRNYIMLDVIISRLSAFCVNNDDITSLKAFIMC